MATYEYVGGSAPDGAVDGLSEGAEAGVGGRLRGHLALVSSQARNRFLKIHSLDLFSLDKFYFEIN